MYSFKIAPLISTLNCTNIPPFCLIAKRFLFILALFKNSGALNSVVKRCRRSISRFFGGRYGRYFGEFLGSGFKIAGYKEVAPNRTNDSGALSLG